MAIDLMHQSGKEFDRLLRNDEDRLPPLVKISAIYLQAARHPRRLNRATYSECFSSLFEFDFYSRGSWLGLLRSAFSIFSLTKYFPHDQTDLQIQRRM